MIQLYLRHKSRVKLLEIMFVEGTEIIQQFNQTNLYVNYEKSNAIDFKNYIHENVSFNCLLNNKVVSETKNIIYTILDKVIGATRKNELGRIYKFYVKNTCFLLFLRLEI